MSCFVQIVDCGSLTAAAEAMDTSLPTVVRTLANLEAHLKTRLLNRTTRRITLSVEGQLYLERCRRILFEVDDAELALSAQQGKPSGKLLVSASVMFGSIRVAPLLHKFLRDNDQISIQLSLQDRNVNLVDEGVDVAIRMGPLSDSSMVAKNVGTVRRVICATPKLLNTLPVIREPKDLLNVPCIRFTGLSQGGSWQLFDGDKRHLIAVEGPLVCDQAVAALNAVKSGLGVGMFLSYMVEDELASGELQLVLEDFEPPLLPVSVVYSHSKLMSTRVRVFVDWVIHELRRSLRKTPVARV
jgi:DNA-binding transcriptional LysR family regulator